MADSKAISEIIIRQHETGGWTWRYGIAVGSGGDTAQSALDGARDHIIRALPGGWSVRDAQMTVAQVYPWNGTHFTVPATKDVIESMPPIRLPREPANESPKQAQTVPPPDRYRKSAHQITDSTGALGSWKWELRYGGAGALMDFGYQDTEAVALIESDKALSRRLLKDTQEASNRANAALRQGVNRHIEATQAATDALRDSKEAQATVQKFDARPEPPKEGEPTYYVEGNPMPHIGIVGDLATSTTSPLQYWRKTESGWVAIGGIVPAKEETVMQPASTEHPLPKMVWSGEDEPDVTPAAKNLRLTLRRHAERHVAKLVVLEADYCMAKKNKRRRKLQWDMNEAITRLHEIDELTPIWTLLNGEAGAV